MSDDEVAKAPDVQHIPTVIGGVVLTYNLDGIDKPLKLDGATIAAIYMGEITKWDDPKLAALNPGVTLPSKDIQVVFRSDSSGTSFVFTDYLSKVSPEFKSKIGPGKAPNFESGQGGQGNDGVTNVVKNTPNAIGYVELNYALTNKLAYADIENKTGTFVTPTVESVSAAAAGVQLPDDYRVSITDADGDDAYPIASFTYILVHKTTGECSQQTPLVNFLWWEIHDTAAQATINDLNYSPLPDSLKTRVSDTLKSLKCDNGSSPSLKGG
jgi:phosphate transport system substrate-binding protein